MVVKICFFFCCLTIQIYLIHSVGIDYYFSSALRSQPKQSLACKSRFHKVYCQIKCGKQLALCISDACYCLPNTPVHARKLDTKQWNRENDTMTDDYAEDFKDFEEGIPVEQSILPENTFYGKRRHHIAHFCPNLDAARACIKKCMKMGKPTFCGKDHVCYCGHKYSSHDNDHNAGDPAAIYAEFKDLYEKYFGPAIKHDSFEFDPNQLGNK